MEHSSSDEEDSIASSGDEMLKIDIFSPTRRKSSAPANGRRHPSQRLNPNQKRSHTESDSDDKKRKRNHDAGNLKDDNNDGDDAADGKNNIALANATNAFDIEYNDQKIGTTNKLYWNKRRQKKNVALYPIRVVPREEVLGLHLKEWDAETERPVQYIQYPHKQIKKDLGLYDVVTVKSLTPYHGDGPADSWCSKRILQYSKQLNRSLKGMTEIDLITEEAFLNLVLKQSLKEEENERERSLLDKAAPIESVASEKEDEKPAENDSDDDDDDVDGSSGGRRSRLCRSNNVKSEPLRVGDVIEYYKPGGHCGDSNDLCEAEVKFINPKGDPILITSDVFTKLSSDANYSYKVYIVRLIDVCLLFIPIL